VLIFSDLETHINYHMHDTRVYEGHSPLLGRYKDRHDVLDYSEVVHFILTEVLQLECEKLNEVITAKLNH
jgi:hypothetical protein